MDYCYACRRHLNGAYSCPGCGTPAEQLTMPGAPETAQLPVVPGGEDDPYDGGPPGSRAARRLEGRRAQARRAKRGRQRAAVYGVGAVAVIGSLTMFSMAALSGGSGGGSGEQRPRVGNLSPVPVTGTSAPDGSPDVTTPPTRRHGSASASASPTASKATTAPPTRKPTRPPVTASGTVSPRPSTAPPTSTAPPSPRPTKTRCKPVLWWCQ